MGYTVDDLASVEAAIRALISGDRVAAVTIDGDTVQYSRVQLPELRSIRDEIKAEVADADGTAVQSFIVTGSKGL